MPTCHKRKFIFFHITKTGGTSIEKALGVFGNPSVGNENLMFGGMEDGAAQHYPHEIYFKYRPAIEKEYFKFTFVRNPFDRMVSQYTWQDCKDMSFEAFVREASSVVARGDFFGNEPCFGLRQNKIHFCPQYRYILDKGSIAVDFTGKFENLVDDFNKLCTHIGFSYQLPHLNSTKREPYRNYYNEKTRKIVHKMYEKDFDLLKYTF